MDAYRPLYAGSDAARDLQRIDAPRTAAQIGAQAALVGAWLCVNVGITLLNKAVLGHFGFAFPLALSLLHQTTTLAVVAALLHVVYPALAACARKDGADGGKPGGPPREGEGEHVQPVAARSQWRYVVFGVLNAVNVCASNVAMQLASVSLREVVASTTPVLVCVGERLWLHTQHSLATYAALAPTIVGALVVSASSVDATSLGVASAASVPVLVAVRSVASKLLMVSGDCLTPLNLLYRTSLPSALVIVPAALYVDAARVGVWAGAAGGAALAALAASAALAAALNLVSLAAMRATSPLTMQVAGNLKSALTIGVSMLFIEARTTPAAAAGVALTLAGCAAYAGVRVHAMRASPRETAGPPLGGPPGFSPPPPPPPLPSPETPAGPAAVPTDAARAV